MVYEDDWQLAKAMDVNREHHDARIEFMHENILKQWWEQICCDYSWFCFKWPFQTELVAITCCWLCQSIQIFLLLCWDPDARCFVAFNTFSLLDFYRPKFGNVYKLHEFNSTTNSIQNTLKHVLSFISRITDVCLFVCVIYCICVCVYVTCSCRLKLYMCCAENCCCLWWSELKLC